MKLNNEVKKALTNSFDQIEEICEGFPDESISWGERAEILLTLLKNIEVNETEVLKILSEIRRQGI